MTTESVIKIYEIDSEDVDDSKMIVQSHWNISDFVVIRIGSKAYTVSRRQLDKAVQNAVNVDR